MADVIRQALVAGVVDELGAGTRLFEGFHHDVGLDILSVHHSSYAVHVRYAVRR